MATVWLLKLAMMIDYSRR